MKIALCGLGKAGRQIIRLVYQTEGMDLTMSFCRNGGKFAGKTLSDLLHVRGLGCRIYELEQADALFLSDKPDVVIDFSGKKATLALLPVCAKHGVHMVVCTTNFTKDELAYMCETAQATPGFALVYAPNITLGINVLMQLANQAAHYLPDYDYAVTEKHYRKKEDVSASAKKITEMLSATLGKPVALNSIRAGGYVGLHEVLIAGEFERITIIHESFSRQAFANGALIAAQFVCEGREGYFEMKDVLEGYFQSQREK